MYIVDELQAVFHSYTVPIRRTRAKSGNILTRDVLPSPPINFLLLLPLFSLSSFFCLSHLSLQSNNRSLLKLLSSSNLSVTRQRCIVKGKAVPLQAWSCPEGSRKLRLPDFLTMAQDGGTFVSLTHRPPLPPRNNTGTHFC
jgi:hypothetical protein